MLLQHTILVCLVSVLVVLVRFAVACLNKTLFKTLLLGACMAQYS